MILIITTTITLTLTIGMILVTKNMRRLLENAIKKYNYKLTILGIILTDKI